MPVRTVRCLFVLALGLPALAVLVAPASAASPVGLGTATSFAVLGGSTVTNTGPSVISGDLGVSPGTSVTGFPPGTVNNGTIHAADGVAAQAQSDATTAYNNAAGQTPFTSVTADLGGQTLVPGVYRAPTLGLTGTVTLNGQGDPNAVFIFQAGSTLITGSSSVVALIGNASACNVFWQVGSSATLGTDSTFAGTVVALTSVTATTRAAISGRLIARNGAVTLDSNTVTRPVCAAAVASPTPSPTSTTSPAATPSPTSVASPTATPSASPASTPTLVAVPTTTGGTGLTDVPVAGPAAPVPAVPPSTVTSLPRTGSPLGDTAAAGWLAMVVGTALLVASRRPKTRARHATQA
ncbi:MAG: hypothetical protein QOE99_1901 [Actinomycetota bacterium]|jgi:hypothetical protein|nr:hypothetical protein [Actinomycetota bacterium]